MITNFISDIVGSAANAVAALPLKEGAAWYLVISLLGPVCWITAIEVCRFVRAAKENRLEKAPAAALMIATRRHPATPGLMDSPLREN